MAALTDSPSTKLYPRRAQTVSSCCYHTAEILDCSKGLCLAPIRYKTANGSYHSTRRASEFTPCPEIIAITSISSASKKIKTSSSSKVLSSNSCLQNLVLSSPKILSPSPSSTLPLIPKIRCRAKLFLHRSFQSQKSSLFPLARHRNKIKLIVPRRQTVLRNSPTRLATPCARPKNLQIANWKARILS
ncbi:hypothetical protein AVEN_275201-1 [Araneus ventricosus]|uniref:Uncharacterized protein n=1 Tax=Araneus ventricosus TaxID=182803 RepID=A0A4Y2NMH3_ARAVE|nr:hypothetical protein AVEN_275201-1 [Araneus ventricosus]